MWLSLATVSFPRKPVDSYPTNLLPFPYCLSPKHNHLIFLILIQALHHVCMHMEAGEQHWVSFSMAIHLSWDRVWSWTQSSLVPLDWLAKKPKDPPVSSSSAPGLQVHTHLLDGCWGSKLWSSGLLSRHFSKLAGSLAPDLFIWLKNSYQKGHRC